MDLHGNSKFTPEVQKAICDGIKNGIPIEDVCDIVSITRQTFCRWMRQGKSDHIEDAHYVAFRYAVKKARAANRAWHIKNIKRHSKATWQASAWFLERRDPVNWGKKETEQIGVLLQEIADLKAKLIAVEAATQGSSS